MAATDSNINLNQTAFTGQTGLVTASLVPQLIKAVVLVPKGTRIPAANLASQSVFATYVNALFRNDSYAAQWFAITPLSGFKNSTDGDSVWTTAPYKIKVFQYPHLYEFNYLSSVENFVELTGFNNCQGRYDYFLIDQSGNWWGTLDTSGANGLQAFNNQQFWVGNRMPATDKEGEMYPISMQLGSALETNGNVKFYQAGYDSSSIPMLQNAVITDVSAVSGMATALGAAYTAGTDQVIIIKGGQDSIDLVKFFGALIVASPTVLVATDLTVAGTPVISGIVKKDVVVGNQAYSVLIVTYTAPPTATHKIQLALAAQSVVIAAIPTLTYVTATALTGNGLNGNVCGVKTF